MDRNKISAAGKIFNEHFGCGCKVVWLYSPEHKFWLDNDLSLNVYDVEIRSIGEKYTEVGIKAEITDKNNNNVIADTFTQRYSFSSVGFRINLGAIQLASNKTFSNLNIGGKIIEANQNFILNSLLNGTMDLEASSVGTCVGAAYWAPRYFNFTSSEELDNVKLGFKTFFATKQNDGIDVDDIYLKLDNLKYPFEFYGFDDGLEYEMKNCVGKTCNVGKYILSNNQFVSKWFGTWNEQYASVNHPIRKGCDALLAKKGKTFDYPNDVDEIIKSKYFYLEY